MGMSLGLSADVTVIMSFMNSLIKSALCEICHQECSLKMKVEVRKKNMERKKEGQRREDILKALLQAGVPSASPAFHPRNC